MKASEELAKEQGLEARRHLFFLARYQPSGARGKARWKKVGGRGEGGDGEDIHFIFEKPG